MVAIEIRKIPMPIGDPQPKIKNKFSIKFLSKYILILLWQKVKLPVQEDGASPVTGKRNPEPSRQAGLVRGKKRAARQNQ